MERSHDAVDRHSYRLDLAACSAAATAAAAAAAWTEARSTTEATA